MKLNEKQIKAMQEELCIELAQILVDEWNYDIEEALTELYNSETFERLNNPATGLYYQSAGYIYNFLRNEMTTGRFS